MTERQTGNDGADCETCVCARVCVHHSPNAQPATSACADPLAYFGADSVAHMPSMLMLPYVHTPNMHAAMLRYTCTCVSVHCAASVCLLTSLSVVNTICNAATLPAMYALVHNRRTLHLTNVMRCCKRCRCV